MTLSLICFESGTCLWYNLDPGLEWAADWSLKLNYLCTALVTAWMGADSALKDAV